MIKSSKQLISIVLPVYCESANIGALLGEIRDTIGGLEVDYEFVLVDDGSNSRLCAPRG